ncbi:hypothetical protein OIU76_027051 [Salix suchowensis]|uniref:Uncharacterized protein n=1 Tax=Salix koriyanagi TaxID=2511006 RepID=A0A9Q0W1V4_9ROSI|nr:hypothetical protein OIU78_024179 [Salix suchowensis]KAJ6372656.1 hypothetical protein OIU76_027051 [Salix suchowensis]KAJ6759049.1 hypothetical protein OIU74_025665 [Salix koriyanagi]
MNGLSIFSRKKVKDEQDDVLQNEKDPGSLETMSAEMTSLKSRLLSKEVEVQIMKDMVAQKDEIIKRLRVRDLKVDVLRADVESAWKKFDSTYLSITSPERSKNEMKHEKEPGEEEIKGMAREEDEIRISHLCYIPPDRSSFYLHRVDQIAYMIDVFCRILFCKQLAI